MEINNKKVSLFYDLIDKACMVYYNELGKDYLEGLIQVSFDLDSEEIDFNDKLSKKAIDKLLKYYDEINNNDFLNEEVRLALELIIVKGFKHRNILLDFMTPDAINYIFVHIIKSIIENTNIACKDFTILDTCLGTSNLLLTILNNIDMDISGVGIENDELMTHLAKAFSNLLNNEIIINYNNALDDINTICDIVIGDFGEVTDIYKIIEKRIDNLKDNGYFIYLVNNDFFKNASNEFRNNIKETSTIFGMIVLPSKFTNKEHIGKSIIIGKKSVLNSYDMGIIQMKEELSQENLIDTFNKIEKLIKNINRGI